MGRLINPSPSRGPVEDWRSSTCGPSPSRRKPTAATVALACAVPGDAVAKPLATAKLLDIDMNQLTRMLSLVATHRLARLEIALTVQTHSFQNAADGVRRNPDARGNMRAGKTLATQFADPRDDMLWCRPVRRCGREEQSANRRPPRRHNAPPICGRCADRRLRL